MPEEEDNQCNIGDRAWTFLVISNEAFFIFALLISQWENGKLRGGTFFNINLFLMEMSWNQTNCGVIDKELMSGESFDYFWFNFFFVIKNGFWCREYLFFQCSSIMLLTAFYRGCALGKVSFLLIKDDCALIIYRSNWLLPDL